jgi:hypothetical protein
MMPLKISRVKYLSIQSLKEKENRGAQGGPVKQAKNRQSLLITKG